MRKQSAGILLYKITKGVLQVLLVHPGGPFWAKKDAGAWSIPKGEFTEEDPLQAAQREFTEETGFTVEGDFIALTPVHLRSGKKIFAWAARGELPADNIQSNHFELEWPPKSGNKQTFPEVDKAGWFTVNEAKEKINPAQVPLVDELATRLQMAG